MPLELKAPAGSMKSAIAAIEAGADSLYLGLRAGQHQRSQVANFSPDEVRTVVSRASDSGCGVYVTLNSSMVGDQEAETRTQLDFLASVPVTGVIVADPGLVQLISREYPELRILYSIQGECSNSEYAALLGEMGVHRIVLERNLTIDEAKRIKRASGVEVELFVFGYTCNSHDSLCYMGDYWSGQPCNVHCAQKVRFLDQPGLTEPKRYLFMKYYSALRYIPQLWDAGIDGLKIEGRQRSAHVVERVTQTFREAIDSYEEIVAKGGSWRVEERWTKALRTAAMNFEVTDGWYQKNEFKRTIIAEPSLKTKLSYVQDTLRTKGEGGQLRTLTSELGSAWRRSRSTPDERSSEREGLKITGV